MFIMWYFYSIYLVAHVVVATNPLWLQYIENQKPKHVCHKKLSFFTDTQLLYNLFDYIYAGMQRCNLCFQYELKSIVGKTTFFWQTINWYIYIYMHIYVYVISHSRHGTNTSRGERHLLQQCWYWHPQCDGAVYNSPNTNTIEYCHLWILCVWHVWSIYLYISHQRR